MRKSSLIKGSCVLVLFSLCLVQLTPALAQDRRERYPAPPSPVVPDTRLEEQAGVGSELSYATAGVMELGGSLGLTAANDFFQTNVSPSIGWFVADNLELSAITSVNHVRKGGASGTYFTLLAEPSFHVPFSRTLFGFVGLGAGMAYIDEAGAGLALTPRIGANIMVGRSGILKPALYLAYSAVESVPTDQGDMLAIDVLYGLSVGYTVMW